MNKDLFSIQDALQYIDGANLFVGIDEGIGQGKTTFGLLQNEPISCQSNSRKPTKILGGKCETYIGVHNFNSLPIRSGEDIRRNNSFAINHVFAGLELKPNRRNVSRIFVTGSS